MEEHHIKLPTPIDEGHHPDPAADTVRIIVPGAVVPWQRARRRRLGDGRVITFTDRKVETFHGLVRTVAVQAMNGRPPFSGPIELTVVAVFLPPASWSPKKRAKAIAGEIAKTTRPDLENLFKGAQDAMQTIVYRDDLQIIALYAAKVFGDTPCLEIELRPLWRSPPSKPRKELATPAQR